MSTNHGTSPWSEAFALRGWTWPVLGIAVYWIPLYLLQQDMYDGVPLAFAFQHKVYEGFRQWQLGSAWHLAYGFHMTLFALAEWLDVSRMLLVKLALLMAFIGLFFQYRWYLRELFGLDGDEAQAVAFLASLFISPQIYAASLGAMLPALILAGLAGYRLLRSRDPVRAVPGFLLVVVSFQLNSMLVFMPALHVGFMLARRRIERRELVLLAALLVAGIVFFLGRKFVFPPSGPYATYNAIRLPTDWESMRPVLRAALMFLTWLVIPLTALAVACLWMLVRGEWVWRAIRLSSVPAAWVSRALVAALLFAAAAFPYAVVAKGPPLFTATALGTGITEQALRAFYAGPLAPGFSLTSGRHGVLLMLAMSMFIFLAAILPRELFGKSRQSLSVRAVLVIGLIAMLPWILGGAWNRLVQQRAEVALARGLAALPAAPPGVIELRYSPVSDWLLHTDTANRIAADAWGKPQYFAMMYSLPAYLRELQWQYNAFFKNIGGLHERWLQESHSMIGFPGERCLSRYSAVLAPASIAEVLLAGVSPSMVTPASVNIEDSQCIDGRKIDNPMPERAASY